VHRTLCEGTAALLDQAGAESYVLKTASADELLAAIQGKDQSA
jgi:DNA-binding NarL/FixJ family response regulator